MHFRCILRIWILRGHFGHKYSSCLRLPYGGDGFLIEPSGSLESVSHITEDLPALLVKDIKGGEVTDLGYPGIARRCKQIKVKSGKGSKDYRF